MARIALKVDVDTLRGTREGVPRLLDVLAKAGARATFLWSLGPDHTGWALRRIFRPGFFAKVSRTSVLEHYGLKTLLYGVLLPAPDIGREAASVDALGCAMPATSAASTPGTTSSGRTTSAGATGPGPRGRCASRSSASAPSSARRRARTAPPAGR